MNELAQEILVFAPFLLAVIATGVVWRSVDQRGLYFCSALLSCLGIQALVSPVAVSYWFFSGRAALSHSNDAFVRSLATSAVFQIIAGGPFLFWLRRGLKRRLPLDTDAARQPETGHG
jgi:hypothetical protein